MTLTTSHGDREAGTLVVTSAVRAQASSGSTSRTQAAESGFRLLRRLHVMSLIILTWLFFFLYGPIEGEPYEPDR
jgi:hypothetical protein